MENKKLEKKSVLKKLTIGIAAMALISCAFVGGTFARYTSQGEVSNGGANVADWYINVQDGSGATDVVFTISPNFAAYADSQTRKFTANKGGDILVFTNYGEVAAKIKVWKTSDLQVYQKTFTKDANGEVVESQTLLEADTTYTAMDGSTFQWDDDNFKPLFVDASNGYSVSTEWANVSLYANSGNSILKLGGISMETVSRGEAGAGEIEVTGTGADVDNAWTFTLLPGDSISVKMGETTWTSDFGDNGDVRDTWVGENIAKIGYGFQWAAEQATSLPEGGTPAP